MKTKKLIVFTLVISILFSLNTYTVKADTINVDNLSVDAQGQLKNNYNHQVKYLDPSLSKSSTDSISTNGLTSPVYAFSSYKVKSSTLLSYDARGPEKETFIISVAKGSTSTITNSVTVQGTITSDLSLNSGEKEAIAFQFSLSTSGSISKTYEKSTIYKFPSDYTGKYSTANYYAAVYYDKYSVTYDKTDWYTSNIPARPMKTTEVTKTVYIPKIVSYTRGANY